MSRRRRYLPPFEVEIEGLGKGGAGVGVAPDGKPVQVKPAPPGSRVAVVPAGRKKAMWLARRTAMVRPPPGWSRPRCAAFGVCGGCSLQELALADQREAKRRRGVADVAAGLGIAPDALEARVGGVPVHGGASAYGYRNKVELSFGHARFVREAEHREGAPIDGRWMGFHAPGRFDRVADAPRCELVSEAANALIGAARGAVIDGRGPAAALPLWDPRGHGGFWRHLLLREGMATGELLVGVYTAPAAGPVGEGVAGWTVAEAEAAVDELVQALQAAPLSASVSGGASLLVSVQWFENDGVADVARGTRRRVWGATTLRERLGPVAFELSPESFFQTSTEGAAVLYDVVVGALAGAPATLLDLYCGIGSIGLYVALSGRVAVQRLLGVEEVAPAVADATVNAERNGLAARGVEASFRVARCEHALEVLDGAGASTAVVVDPPRVGLHPKVAARLAHAHAERLVYVACKPSSLGRDAAILEAGGWRLVRLEAVDLFPQTGHLEMVGVFRRG